MALAQAVTLTVTKLGTGSGTVTSSLAGINCGADCTESYPSGTVVTLTASPSPGSVFGGWSGDCSGTPSSVVMTITASKSCTARFDPAQAGTVPLTVTKVGTGSGTVASDLVGINCGADCTENYQTGTVVTLTATPGPGSVFGGWFEDCSGTPSSVVVTMTAAKSCRAGFDPAQAVTPFTMISPLPPATVGQSYSQTLAVTGGAAPYEWSVDNTSLPLPPGITLSPLGVLGGVPAAAGSTTFTVRVKNSNTAGQLTVTKTLTLTVVPAVGQLEITSPLPPAKQGLPYSQSLTVSGGTAPYAWSVISGAPPAGIALSPSAGVLSGTPTQSGSVTFTVMVTNSTTGGPRTTTGSFKLTVD